jgi:hypothetical protein
MWWLALSATAVVAATLGLVFGCVISADGYSKGYDDAKREQ